jgi:predicted permease
MHSALIVNRVLPILILLGLGVWCRRTQFITDQVIDGLKKLAVNMALPAAMFISFLEVAFEIAYLYVFIAMLAACLVLFGLGFLIRRTFNVSHPYFPFLITGFEYGMLGVSLFGSAYGLEKLGYIAVVDLGHEIFIWFIFLAALMVKRDSLETPGQLLKVFFRSPVVLGILSGIGLNVLGAQALMQEGLVTGGIMATLRFLSNLTVPLILLAVGYDIKLDMAGVKEALPTVAIRLGLILPLIFVLSSIVFGGMLKLAQPFIIATVVLMILPPSFLIPLYIPPEMEEERRYVNNTLILSTVISIVMFAVYFVLNPQI